MFSNHFNHHILEVNLLGQPVSHSDIEKQKVCLKSVFHTYLNYILAVIVLGSAVTYRALSLHLDSEHELINMSLYIGVWFGLFTGLMIDGNGKRKLQMSTVGVLVSTSASLFSVMLIILFVGGAQVWMSSIIILFSALASIWVLTSYDEVIKGFDSIKIVSEREKRYMDRAAANFEELNNFYQKIIKTDRSPIAAEYWLMREWIQHKIELGKSS